MPDAPVRLVGLAVDDPPAAWRAAGFAVADDRVHLAGVTIELVGQGREAGEEVREEREESGEEAGETEPGAAPEPQADPGGGVRGWRLDSPAPGSCDGLPALPEPGPRPLLDTAPAHPNGVVALDHVVVATDDLERTTAALHGLGLVPRRTVVGARGDGDDEVAYRFFLLGTCVLELVGPTRPYGLGPARFTGLAFTTEALDALGSIAGAPRDAVQPGRRIATLRGAPLGVSVPVAFLSPRPSPER